MLCQHENTVDDHRSGDVICLACGVVVEKVMLYSNNKADKISFQDYTIDDNFYIS